MTFGIPVGIAVLAAASIGGAYYMTSGSSAAPPPKETKDQVYLDNRPRNASVVGALPVETSDNETSVSLGGRRRKTRKSKNKRRRTKKNRKL